MSSQVVVDEPHPPAPAVAGAPLGAAVTFVAPVALLVAFLYHPHIGNPTDAGFFDNLAAAVIADPLRWALAHLLTAVASGLLALAFLAVRAQLRAAGEERWSAWALPFIIMGCIFYALLPAMEFAPLTAAQTGGDVAGAQRVLMPWFVPVLFTSALLYAVGAVGFATGIARSSVLSHGMGRVVAGALIIMAAARFVPLSMVQFNVQGAAGIVALWPLAYAMMTRPSSA